MVTTAISPAPGEQEPQAKIGAIGRVIGVLFSPKETFEDIARKPSWVFPIILMSLIWMATNVVLAGRADWVSVAQQNVEKNKFAASRIDQLNDQQKQAAFAQQAAIAKITRYVRGAIGTICLALLGALVWMGVFNIFGGAGVGYVKSLALVSYAYIPIALHDLLAIPIVLMKDPAAINPENLVASNLAALLPSSAPVWQQVLGGSVDLFAIWCLILVAMAFSAANPRKLSFGKALGLAIGLHVVITLVAVGVTSIFA
jgi:hypothetical protein